MKTQLFLLLKGEKFKVEGYPFVFIVNKAYRDTIGKVEVCIENIDAPLYLNSLIDIDTLEEIK